VSKGN
jgi:hypothetical protein